MTWWRAGLARFVPRRLQINYVHARGDELGYTRVHGLRGHAIFAQFQLCVESESRRARWPRAPI